MTAPAKGIIVIVAVGASSLSEGNTELPQRLLEGCRGCLIPRFLDRITPNQAQVTTPAVAVVICSIFQSYPYRRRHSNFPIASWHLIHVFYFNRFVIRSPTIKSEYLIRAVARLNGRAGTRMRFLEGCLDIAVLRPWIPPSLVSAQGKIHYIVIPFSGTGPSWLNGVG